MSLPGVVAQREGGSPWSIQSNKSIFKFPKCGAVGLPSACQDWRPLRAEEPCLAGCKCIHQQPQNSKLHRSLTALTAPAILLGVRGRSKRCHLFFHRVAQRPRFACGPLQRHVGSSWVGTLSLLSPPPPVRLSRFHRPSYKGCLTPLIKEVWRRIHSSTTSSSSSTICKQLGCRFLRGRIGI